MALGDLTAPPETKESYACNFSRERPKPNILGNAALDGVQSYCKSWIY